MFVFVFVRVVYKCFNLVFNILCFWGLNLRGFGDRFVDKLVEILKIKNKFLIL